MSSLDLPLTPVFRLVKSALPEGTQLGKDSKNALVRAAGVFILYLSSTAHDFSLKAKRSTLTAEDIMAALEEIDFSDFLPRIQSLLEAVRSDSAKKKQAKRSNSDSTSSKTTTTKKNKVEEGPKTKKQKTAEKPKKA
eukprot:TRINITY_DN4045_c0_g1_i1.p1 TRINITY_DN4045_c0_g1~~TRINITY_DN4045_c0_g1_i1.p1  ORF type:complete len:137 (+),score=39.34 TRINITY_DN4045_c0_g1_i1:91-501(+)